MHEPLEFLRQAIPRLKSQKIRNSESFHFLYTNLKGQKQLYESPATLIINGYKVPSFTFLGTFEKNEIVSISALYNSETLVSSRLNALLPGGAVEVNLKWSSKAIEKLAGLPLFSFPYDWPHDLQPPGETQARISPRYPLFTTLYHWSEPVEKDKSISVNLPRTRVQAVSMSYFSMATVKNETYRKIFLKID
jgi:hypothetical protein